MKPISLLIVLTFVLFLALKLCSVIAWSWWWIFSPIWISWSFVLTIAAIGLWAKIQKERQITKVYQEAKKRGEQPKLTKFQMWVEGAKAKQEELKNRKP